MALRVLASSPHCGRRATNMMRHHAATLPCAAALTGNHRSLPNTRVLSGSQLLHGWASPEASPGQRPLLKGRKPVLLGRVSSPLPVSSHVVKPPYAVTGRVARAEQVICLHGEESRQKMRAAGKLARKMLDYACSLVRVGITTDEIDVAVHQAMMEHGAYPSPLNYAGFPKSICSSINEVVIHGIPDDRPLRDGDIAKLDVSLYLDGVHGDNCATVCVGEVDEQGWRLVDAARKALDEAVAVCRPGACMTEVGAAVHRVADESGFSTVTTYSGHGIGSHLHMFPHVLHCRNQERLRMKPGMIFTIEPMLLEGAADVETLEEDGWTVVSRDGGRGAQFEHTVLITEEGAEVITSLDGTARAGGSERKGVKEGEGVASKP